MATVMTRLDRTDSVRKVGSIKKLRVIKTSPDRGIPMPMVTPKRKPRQEKFEFIKFKVGDSILFEHSSYSPAYMERDNFIHQSRRFNIKKSVNWKFTSRTVKGGIRIWRIK